jgi:hypothetical protein
VVQIFNILTTLNEGVTSCVSSDRS